MYCFMFGVGLTKMNQIIICTLKYRDTCSAILKVVNIGSVSSTGGILEINNYVG